MKAFKGKQAYCCMRLDKGRSRKIEAVHFVKDVVKL